MLLAENEVAATFDRKKIDLAAGRQRALAANVEQVAVHDQEAQRPGLRHSSSAFTATMNIIARRHFFLYRRSG